MAILTVTGLAVSFATQLLFSNVNFELAPGEKAGLIGVNGSGKTTLLRVVQGLDKPDAGMAHMANDARLACAEQQTDPTLLQSQSLYEYTEQAFLPLMNMEAEIDDIEGRLAREEGNALRLSDRLSSLYNDYTAKGGLTFRARARAALLGLGFWDAEQARSLASFSGGQAGRAKLARAILTEADLLLLDEPTNHLDLSAVLWLEDYLLAYKGAALIVSHDRRFLDKVTTRTLELENGRLLSAPGGYSRYTELKQGKRAAQEKLYKAQLKEIKRIEGIIDQQRRWNQARNFITIAAKQKEIDRIRARLDPPARDPAAVHFSFKAREIVSRDALIAESLSYAFDPVQPLFRNASFRVGTGETVCLVGPNGCGKTTILKLLAKRLSLQNGHFRFADGLQLGYYAQTTDTIIGGNTVLSELQNSFPRMDAAELRNALALFLFRGDEIYKKTEILSGGERARIKLLQLMLSGTNFLLLDEPTNHLDLASAETLENAIENYTGTCLLVTHDRHLIERLADRVLFLAPNGIRELEFPFEESYLAALSNIDMPVGADTIRPPEPTTPELTALPPEPNTYHAQKHQKAARARAKQALRAAEAAIITNETQIRDTEQEIESATTRGEYETLEPLYALLSALQEENHALYLALDAAERELETYTSV
ncbi:MAG: ATP-binding cassette domain-containing protein [Clostridiales bacterium]|nr:ATP-binding cassette domain-containing protein [Clostridiales bacterium]